MHEIDLERFQVDYANDILRLRSRLQAFKDYSNKPPAQEADQKLLKTAQNTYSQIQRAANEAGNIAREARIIYHDLKKKEHEKYAFR